jgi:hypothetical protein
MPNTPQPEGNDGPAKLGFGAPKGWYSRGYLPHYNNRETIQSVTFRLADSLPQSKLREMEDEMEGLPPGKADAERRKKIEFWLDAGIGCCALGHLALASIMREALLKWDGDHFDNVRYYIDRNPVTAGLCAQPCDWPWSSAAGNAEPQLGAESSKPAKPGHGVPGDASIPPCTSPH